MSIYAHLRKSNPVNELTPRSSRWLGTLPQNVRPYNLRNQFPRIVNRAAAVWDNPAAFGEFSTELLYDFRGDRAGFPAEIVCELRALREYYYQRTTTPRR